MLSSAFLRNGEREDADEVDRRDISSSAPSSKRLRCLLASPLAAWLSATCRAAALPEGGRVLEGLDPSSSPSSTDATWPSGRSMSRSAAAAFRRMMTRSCHSFEGLRKSKIEAKKTTVNQTSSERASARGRIQPPKRANLLRSMHDIALVPAPALARLLRGRACAARRGLRAAAAPLEAVRGVVDAVDDLLREGVLFLRREHFQERRRHRTRF